MSILFNLSMIGFLITLAALIWLIITATYYKIKQNNVNYHKNKKLLHASSLGLVVCFVTLMISAPPKDNNAASEQVAHEAEETKHSIDKTQLPISSITFRELRKAKQSMTSLQFDEFKKGLVGQRIQWTGYVFEVKKTMFDSYEVSVDMDSLDDFSLPEISISTDQKTALSLSKGQVIGIDGIIQKVDTIMGVLDITMEEPLIALVAK